MHDVEQKKAKPVAHILIDVFAIAVAACAWLANAPLLSLPAYALWCLAAMWLASVSREAWRFLYASWRIGPIACVRFMSLCFVGQKKHRLRFMPGWSGFSCTYAHCHGKTHPEALLLVGSFGNAILAVACAGIGLLAKGPLPMAFFAFFFASAMHPLIPTCSLAPNEGMMLAQFKRNAASKETWETLMDILADMIEGKKPSDIDYRFFISEEVSMPAAAIRFLNAMRIEEFNALDQAYKTYEAVLNDPDSFPLIRILAKCRMRCIAKILTYLDVIPFTPQEEKILGSKMKKHPFVVLMKWMEGDSTMEKPFNKIATRYVYLSQIDECKRLKAQQKQ